MNIESVISLSGSMPGDERREEIRRDKTATDFEELFARHLVREMTKNTFNMADNAGGIDQSRTLYREFITDALAGELAAQRKLGMAELVTKYWDRLPAQDNLSAANTNEDHKAAPSRKPAEGDR